MGTGLLLLPSSSRVAVDGASTGLVGNRLIQDFRYEGSLHSLVIRREGLVLTHSSRATPAAWFIGKSGRRMTAASVRAVAFARPTVITACSIRGVNSFQSSRRRMQCRCMPENQNEESFSIESFSTSSGAWNEEQENTESTSDQSFFQDVKIDLNLPRRRMLVEFTCNVCETRTQRLVNPEAYERGTVFVQCAGCESYHQLVDNLNLIQEYDFRKQNDENPS